MLWQHGNRPSGKSLHCVVFLQIILWQHCCQIKNIVSLKFLFSNYSEEDESEIGEAIKTEPIESDYEILTARSTHNSRPLRSILSPSPRRPGTPKSSRSRVRLSLGDLTEIRWALNSVWASLQGNFGMLQILLQCGWLIGN